MKTIHNNNLQLLGLMSGTSLDGLDIAHVNFDFSNIEDVDFQIVNCKTYPLPARIHEQLSNALELTAATVFELDQQIARFYAACIELFLAEYHIDKSEITAIASHGQTIFHRPDLGFTTQIGCGTTLNFLTGIPVIDQFRQLDVSAGGQGAPLVPIGDQFLFSTFAEGFLNFGGFANISTQKNGYMQAFDIAPANLPMNRWMHSIGHSYDEDGQIARSGSIDMAVLNEALALTYFEQSGPKSLGSEWLEAHYLPLFESLTLANKLRTHIEILKTLCVRSFKQLQLQQIYVTGGGAFNSFLIEQLRSDFSGKLILPEKQIINYKEALIFAFLGARFLRKESTTLSEVTGASGPLRTGILHDFQGRIG